MRQEMQGHDRYGPGGARSSGLPTGMGPRPMGSFPQMMPGVHNALPLKALIGERLAVFKDRYLSTGIGRGSIVWPRSHTLITL